MAKVYDYELVYNYILELIHTEYQEHDKIPSESVLCKKFNLSRLTVRQGINKLKNEGCLYSKQGSGNFVSTKKIVYNISPYTTFSNEIKKLNKKPSLVVLEKKIIKADEEMAEKLFIRESENILYIKNLRLVDNIPFLYAEYYLNLRLLEGVEEKIDTIQSFSKLYTQHYNLEPIRDNSEIDIKSSNYESKKIFGVQNDLPIIKISTKTIDKKTKKTIDYCYSYFRGDLARIKIDYKDNKND